MNGKGLVFGLVTLLLGFNTVIAQKRFTLQKGEINFTSNAELELIKASSTQVQGLMDPTTNQIVFSVDVKTFKGFNSELQREHFNEKYMESERFPKARFSGKIIEQIDLTANNSYDVRVKGDLEIHGVKQTRIIRGKLTANNGSVKIDTKFLVPLEDHNIAVPTLVRQKIATEIDIHFVGTMVLE